MPPNTTNVLKEDPAFTLSHLNEGAINISIIDGKQTLGRFLCHTKVYCTHSDSIPYVRYPHVKHIPGKYPHIHANLRSIDIQELIPYAEKQAVPHFS